MYKQVILALVFILTASPALCGNILIPGCETLHFKAGQTEQNVMFRNPQENSCNFRITLCLEDGQEIWTSGILPPGKTLTAIELSRTLEQGRYRNAIMRYECFSVEDGTKLNGAEVRLNILAK